VFRLEQTRHVGVAKSEHPRLTNGEIIFICVNISRYNTSSYDLDEEF